MALRALRCVLCGYVDAEAGLELVVSAEGCFYTLAGVDGPEFIRDEVVKLVIGTGIEGDTDDVLSGGGLRFIGFK